MTADLQDLFDRAGRNAPAPTLDADAVLRRARRSRNRRVWVSAVAVGIVAAAVAVALRPTHSDLQSGGRSSQKSSCPAPFVGSQSLARGHTVGGLTCLGGRSYRVNLSSPATVTLPPAFVVSGPQADTAVAFSPVRDGVADENTWAGIIEHVVAVQGGDTMTVNLTADPTAGTTPESVAQWLSKRPFVLGATVSRATLAGRPAYRVDFQGGWPTSGYGNESGSVPVLADHTGPGVTHPVFVVTGIRVRCWLLDLPGSGLAVVWSQAPTDTAADLDLNQQFVDSLRFPS